jgi:hypothetical protein
VAVVADEFPMVVLVPLAMAAVELKKRWLVNTTP